MDRERHDDAHFIKDLCLDLFAGRREMLLVYAFVV